LIRFLTAINNYQPIVFLAEKIRSMEK